MGNCRQVPAPAPEETGEGENKRCWCLSFRLGGGAAKTGAIMCEGLGERETQAQGDENGHKVLVSAGLRVDVQTGSGHP